MTDHIAEGVKLLPEWKRLVEAMNSGNYPVKLYSDDVKIAIAALTAAGEVAGELAEATPCTSPTAYGGMSMRTAYNKLTLRKRERRGYVKEAQGYTSWTEWQVVDRKTIVGRYKHEATAMAFIIRSEARALMQPTLGTLGETAEQIKAEKS